LGEVGAGTPVCRWRESGFSIVTSTPHPSVVEKRSGLGFPSHAEALRQCVEVADDVGAVVAASALLASGAEAGAAGEKLAERLLRRGFRGAARVLGAPSVVLLATAEDLRPARTADLEALAAAGAAGLQLDPETLTVDGQTFQVALRVLKVDAEQQQLSVRMRVTADDGSAALPDSRAQFTVGFYDFPVIDNTYLPTGVRCASTLANFSTMSADVVTVCFPGEYASLKDRPYYDEVIQKLREANEQERAAL